MEFKIIFYILVGIGYFVYNNYQKFVSENRKRTFNVPPPQPPVVVTQPVAKPVERKKVPGTIKNLQREPFVKKEIAKRRKEVIIPIKDSLEENFSAQLPAVFNAVSTAPQIQKKPKQKIQLTILRNAILYGEIINQPAWTKY